MAISNTIILLVLFLQCFLLVSGNKIHTTNITRDESALLQFKSKLIDPEGFLKDWAPNRSACEWTGVACGVKHHRVTALDIWNMSLGGTIPPELGNLSFLVYLHMGDNYITGTIPHELVHLRRLVLLNLTNNGFSGHLPSWVGSISIQLQYLSFSFNNFTGTLQPSLFNLTNLVVFGIRNNYLQGEIPQEVGNLNLLTMLDISNNHISGSIPKTIYNISSLETISLRGNSLYGNVPRDLCHYAPRLVNIFLGINQFVGQIPPSLHECSRLTLLSLASNKLTGSIPNFIQNLTMLKSVQLQDNYLSGEFPNEIGNLQQLEELSIFHNSFTGVFPNSISNCSMLSSLYIYGNHFTGNIGGYATDELSIITSLCKCQHLKVTHMSFNPLSGFLPRSIGNFSSSLHTFYADDCEINGIIPDEIGNLTYLQTLGLSSNRLIGFIPTTINGLKVLEQIHLYKNKINGPIPTAICDLPVLGLLDLEANEISGEIPTCLGTVRSLRTIVLSDNLLDSSIPSNLWSLKDLLEIYLKKNRLDGVLPNEVGNFEALITLDLSSNRFSGKVPSSLENLDSLQGLDLSNNNFEGSIPESFSKMISLKSLDLSNNNLEGGIPYSLTKLSELLYFNVSCNKLIGEIPNKGPFVAFNASSFASNDALCGNPRYHVPPCVENSSRRSKRRKLSWWIFVILGISSTLVVLALATLVRKSMGKKQLQVVERNLFSAIRRISYNEVLQATENFSSNNLLGMGSFGSVYKGILNDGTILAIKVFNHEAQGSLESFDVECEVLRNVRHRNLTKVITSISYNDDFKALVLEYMPNGSLEKWLHHGNYFLNMLQRLNIMVDVAHALEYLHYGFSSPIVHCDIKPSYVLLDGDMMGRLSDFGLTRFLNEESFTHTSALATFGYMAPEYGSEGLVSRAGDVYSFGILLMETFTKRKPSGEMFTGGLSLKGWVYHYFLEDQLVQALDSELLSQDEQKLEQETQTLYSLMEFALNCCVDSPKDRMNIKNVRVALEKIKLTV